MREKLIRGAVFIFLVVFGLAVKSFGNPEVKDYSWKDKLKRGAINIVSSPVEIARQIHLTTNEKDLLTGWTVGLIKGLGEGVARFGYGVIDLLTCPFNFPDTHKGPLVEPEYVWQKPGPKYAA